MGRVRSSDNRYSWLAAAFTFAMTVQALAATDMTAKLSLREGVYVQDEAPCDNAAIVDWMVLTVESERRCCTFGYN